MKQKSSFFKALGIMLLSVLFATQANAQNLTVTGTVTDNLGPVIGADGTQFDSSYDRKEPTTFRANQVIKGWTEALTMMPVGSKWELYIPQDLAYGAREAGQIKPFSTLIFEVELVGIEK